MAAPIKPSADRRSIEIGTPLALFSAGVGGAVIPVISCNYAASADGQRFLVNRLLHEGAAPLRVVLNWRPGDGR